MEKGIDIDYDHGTVSLTEYGQGECDGYWGGRDYCWGETTDRSLSLNLCTWGDISISEEEEMVPEDYFEDRKPKQ